MDPSEVELEIDDHTKDEKSELRTTLRECCVATRRFVSSPVVYLSLVVNVWMFVGAYIYHYKYGWSYSVAYYYAVQAGMSVGFGALVEEDDQTRIYTIFHVLVGSSFVAYLLSKVIDVVMEKRQDWYDDEENQHTEYLPHTVWEVLTMDYWYKVWDKYSLLIQIGLTFTVWSSLGFIYGVAYEGYSFIQSVYFTITALSTGGLQAPTIEDETMESAPIFFLGFWLLLGIPFYGAVLGAIAGELIGENSHHKQMEELKKAASTKEFNASIAFATKIRLKDYEIQEQRLRSIINPLKELLDRKDIQIPSNSRKDLEEARAMLEEIIEDRPLDWDTFLQMSLLRLGKVSKDDITLIREAFDDLDINKDGTFDRVELMAHLLLQKMDKDESGGVELEEVIRFARKCYERSKGFANCLNLNKIKTYVEAKEPCMVLFRKVASKQKHTSQQKLKGVSDSKTKEGKTDVSLTVSRVKLMLAMRVLLDDLESINTCKESKDRKKKNKSGRVWTRVFAEGKVAEKDILERRIFRALVDVIGRKGSPQRRNFNELMKKFDIAWAKWQQKMQQGKHDKFSVSVRGCKAPLCSESSMARSPISHDEKSRVRFMGQSSSHTNVSYQPDKIVNLSL